MINLIKNELSKIVHKKAIYILALITILFTILSGVIVKAALSINNFLSDDVYINGLESYLDDYDLNDPEQLNYYVDDKTTIELARTLKEYDTDSWQAYRINNLGYDLLHNVNEAKYIDKDEQGIEDAQKVFDEFLTEIKEHDWQYFVNKDLDSTKNEKENMEKLLENKDLSESEKLSYSTAIESLNYKIDGYEYRLKLGIPDNNSSDSQLVDQYVASATAYQGMTKDEEQIKDYDELVEKRETEKNYYVSKYKLDNDIKSTDIFTTSSLFLSDTVTPVLFVIVAIIMIAGSIVSDEFNKGTIKQLLLRPYRRWKVLLSKYITSIIVFLLFLVFYEVVNYFTYGIILGFDSYSVPIVLYSFTTHEAFEMSLFADMAINLLSILPAYLIILTLTFFMGILTTNGAVSIAVGFLVFFFGNILNQMASVFDSKLVAYIPTMCWNFNSYLFGGLPPYEYSSLGISIMVSVITFLIFLIGSFIIFNKKDIKNQ